LHVEHLDPRTCDWLKSTNPASLFPIGKMAPGDSTMIIGRLIARALTTSCHGTAFEAVCPGGW